jgi:hypothetical protein
MAEKEAGSLLIPKWQRIVGWSAVSISTLVAGFWGFWGSIENFHEGWYFTSLWRNLVLMLVQYLSPMIIASWIQAQQACASLTADGGSISDKPQNLWRLPTVDEAVRSLVYRGRNAGGVWDLALRQAHYRLMPDKDSPLWNVHSQVIYWWTGTEEGKDRAYRISYNGYVFALDKRGWGDYWAYRCVREPSN